MNKTRKATLTLTASLQYAQAVRTFAEKFFIAEEIPRKWAKRLMLISDELFMNAVYYGSNAESEVTLKVWADDKKITFSIQDQGQGKKQIKAADLKSIVEEKNATMDSSKTSGRGLSIITTRWTDECSVDDLPGGGIVIMATKYRDNFLEETQNAGIQDVSHQDTEPVPAEDSQPAPKPNLPTKVIKFSGSIDEHNHEETVQPVNKILEANQPLNLILNFDELNYFNSLFIGAIANWQAKVEKLGGKIAIIGARDSAKEILELCGLDQIIPFYRDEKEALHAIQ